MKSLNEPIAALLFSRLAACAAIDADATLSIVSEKVTSSKIDPMGWVGDGGEGTVQSVKAAGDKVEAGAIVKFEGARGKAPERYGLPITVYTDKSKKKLVNLYGIGL
jgi:hypothetical protein